VKPRARLFVLAVALAIACFASSAKADSIAINGPQNGDIDGAETIWTFFSKFP
jgi:hypothetical protein